MPCSVCRVSCGDTWKGRHCLLVSRWHDGRMKSQEPYNLVFCASIWASSARTGWVTRRRKCRRPGSTSAKREHDTMSRSSFSRFFQVDMGFHFIASIAVTDLLYSHILIIQYTYPDLSLISGNKYPFSTPCNCRGTVAIAGIFKTSYPDDLNT